ncbi:MAG TPA: DinB family protein [Pirellulaceae bacterium]|nr:DinB family protein [Pirellulaceae bacterium]
MAQTDRQLITAWWSAAWTDGLWAAAWSKSIDGLTAEQAAWKPPGVAGQRHSIWQLVLHLIFWRESWLRRLATGQKPTPDETARLNFPEIADRSEAAWAEARRRLADTQQQIAAALASVNPDADLLMHFLPHDCYHFGQINYLRAMQGLPPIE